MRRERVLKRVVGSNRVGPIVLLRITYINGFKSWGVSNGGLALFGNAKPAVRQYVQRCLQYKGY
jgi:hypothetical protein